VARVSVSFGLGGGIFAAVGARWAQLAKQFTSGERWEAVSRTSTAFFADVKYKKGQTRRFAPTSEVLDAKEKCYTGLIWQGVLGEYMIVVLT